MDAFEAQLLAGTEGGRYPFFSPDGQWVGFFAGEKLKRLSTHGGSPLTVCDAPEVGRGATWGPDGTIVFDPGNSGLVRVAADGGTPEPITSHDPAMDRRDLSWPHLLPDGRALLATAGLDEHAELVMLTFETGRWRTLGRGFQAQYVGSGHLVFHAPEAREGEIRAASFDLQTLSLVGTPISVLDGVFRSENSGGAYFAVSASGTMVFARGGHARTLVRMDRNGRRTPLLEERRGFRFPRLSPDGRQVAITIDPRPSQVWVYDLVRRSGIPLTTGGHNLAAIWTQNGSHVTYYSDGDMVSRPADGSSEAARLLARDRAQYPGEWSRDGTLVFVHENANNRADIWAMPVGTDPRPLVATRAHELEPRLSPDERWLAYSSDESGRFEVYVRPFPDIDAGRWPVSTNGGLVPAWSPSGRELFYVNGTTMMAVRVETKDGSFRASTPEVLFTGPFETGSPQFDVSPDGPSFVMVEADPDARPTQVHVVTNWGTELTRRVAAPR
jgi:serine/threonine-protein kinase